MMTNFIFVGGFFDECLEKFIIKNSKGSVQMAANKLQLMFIDGISKMGFDSTYFVSAPFISSFPFNNRIKVFKSLKFNRSPFIYVDFINFPYLKNLVIKKNIIKAVDGLIKEKSKNIVLFYAATSYHYSVIKYLKYNYPDTTIIYYVPDLPEHMAGDYSNKFIYKKINQKKTNDLFKSKKYVDKYVFITENMATYLKVNNYSVLDGMVYKKTNYKEKLRQIEKKYSKVFKKKTIVYTGAVTEKFGVLSLIKQFKLLDASKYELIVCGNGADYDSALKESDFYDNIHVLGTLPNFEVIRIQSEAYALINPMKNNDGLSKYSFPSKMLEYFNAGCLVVGYDLDCYSNDYRSHLEIINPNEENDIFNCILKLENYSIDECIKRAKNNVIFINEKKNNIVQCKSILKEYI